MTHINIFTPSVLSLCVPRSVVSTLSSFFVDTEWAVHNPTHEVRILLNTRTVLMDVPRLVSISVVIGLILRQVFWVQEQKEQAKSEQRERAYVSHVLGF